MHGFDLFLIHIGKKIKRRRTDKDAMVFFLQHGLTVIGFKAWEKPERFLFRLIVFSKRHVIVADLGDHIFCAVTPTQPDDLTGKRERFRIAVKLDRVAFLHIDTDFYEHIGILF